MTRKGVREKERGSEEECNGGREKMEKQQSVKHGGKKRGEGKW